MTRELLPPPGIRVLRVLERGRLTERVLVHVEGEEGAGPAELVRAVDPAMVDGIRRSIAALDRLQVLGLGGLLDVVDDGGAPAVLVTHRRGRLLSSLLVERPRWRAGEAVSALLPLAGTLERMHDIGVAHGALAANRVLITADGVHVIGFDDAELFAAGAPEVVREAVAAVAGDREALRDVAAEVLGRVEGSRAAAAGELCAQVTTAPPARLTDLLTTGLAQLAAATPVAIDDLDVGSDVGLMAAESELQRADSTPHLSALARFIAGLHGDSLVWAVGRIWGQARGRVERMSLTKRRLVVAGGAAIAVAGVLLALIPPQDDRAPSADPSPDPRPSAHLDPGPEAATRAGSEDDPAHAVVSLLERREECFRELSVLCLDEVDQLGSAALAADRSALLEMRGGSEGAAPSVAAVDPRVVERLGDSALVEVGDETAPASLLVMRSEAGWRIRDWVVGG